MLTKMAADLVVLVHLGFVLFVVCGGFLALRWPRIFWVHLPAAFWGALIEFAGWVCPLTPLENQLREASGARGYAGGFVEHYIVPLVYPAEISRETQMVLGAAVVLVNCAVYGVVWVRQYKRRSALS